MDGIGILLQLQHYGWVTHKSANSFCQPRSITSWAVMAEILTPELFCAGFGFTPALLCVLQVPVFRPMDLMVEASPRRIFANAHTYHINSISINSDYETYLSADDLRINLWHLEITDRSFSILWPLFCGMGSSKTAGFGFFYEKCLV